MDNIGDLRVWWIPQVPGTPFIQKVRNLQEAAFLLDVLANYGDFQLKHNIRGDYCNVGGLTMLQDDGESVEWLDWYDEEWGLSFEEYLDHHPELNPL